MTAWHRIVSLQKRSTMKRNGGAYHTSGHLRLYRQRAELAQGRLAEQAGIRCAVERVAGRFGYCTVCPGFIDATINTVKNFIAGRRGRG